MSLITFVRDLQKKREAIPLPGAIIYNAIPARVLKEPERQIALDIIAKIESGNLVDLGSGTGYLSIEIAKRMPRLQVYGIDLSKTMVKIATKHAKNVKNVRFIFCNAAMLPFKDNSIDFIVSTGSLHHWKNPAKVLNESYRVLKDGNEAWIYDGCPDIIEEETSQVTKKYGSFRRWILRRILLLHGFSRQEYETKIRDVLEQTKFRDSYKMEQTDFWMRIVAKKHK